MIYQQELQLETDGHGHLQNLTKTISEIVRHHSLHTGIVNVFNMGSTGAVGTIEFEPGLGQDLAQMLDRLIPENLEYAHQQAWKDGNGHSHLQATLLGPSVTIPIREGCLALGTWQQIVHLECDIKARKRSVLVTMMGE